MKTSRLNVFTWRDKTLRLIYDGQCRLDHTFIHCQSFSWNFRSNVTSYPSRDRLVDELTGEIVYVYSREKELAKLRRKKEKLPSAADDQQLGSTLDDRKNQKGTGAGDALSSKMKKIGQSAMSSLFGRSSEVIDSGPVDDKSMAEAPSFRAAKRMPSLVNGIVVMAPMPSKDQDRWSPCSGSDAASDGASTFTGDWSRDRENVTADHAKVITR